MCSEVSAKTMRPAADAMGSGSSDVAIRVRDVSKHYLMFDRPEDRLKQMVVPRVERLLGRPPRRYFRNFAALSGVSFEVRRGETIGMIGRNGSGKSTMLQIVCGTLQPSGGSVEVNGRIAALLELGAGFNPEFTGRENVYLNAAILGLSRAETDARFDDIVRFADIGPFIEQPVKTYSSGMYVRLAFAVAINVDPDILVVDEALSVGDEAFQRKCFARIEDIRDRGGTILFVTHSAQTIVQLCDRAMLFDRGEMILEGRPKTVTGQYQRLANASPEAAGDVRVQILAMRDAPAEPAAAPAPTDEASPTASEGESDATVEVPVVPAAGELPSPARDEEANGLADYYDPHLVSQSTVSLEERGAKIRDVRITTQSGKPVNVLRMGKKYVFEYCVDFDAGARDVGFAFGVRTTSGFLLSGASTSLSRQERWPSIGRGETKRARFEFVCILLPGTYFWSCGVRGVVDGEEVLLHRMMDALCCRVVMEESTILTGHFDMNVLSTIGS